MSRTTADHRQADVIVVGAGPAGAATGFHLAQHGLDVLILEKQSFPRDKICGDGLTPRAVKQLIAMGVDLDGPGWHRQRGLRIIGGGHRVELDWPELSSFPNYSLVRPRLSLDETLAKHAEKAGARLQERTSVTGPVVDETTGRVTGVTARRLNENGRRSGDDEVYTAPLVVGCDGVSSRLATAQGILRRENRPMAVACRAYYTSENHDDDFLEAHVELWEGKPRESALLPGYGWIFPCGDGTANVGCGVLSTSEAFQRVDYKDMMSAWLSNMPPEAGFGEDDLVGQIRSAALPMGFNRKPHYDNGLLLVGDSGGMVNPFNGEGIDYALESGHLAADVIIQALARPQGPARERALASYQDRLDAEYGGYFTLGRWFSKVIASPQRLNLLTKYALPQPALMQFSLKLMANLTDPHDGDAMDRTINLMRKLAPNA